MRVFLILIAAALATACTKEQKPEAAEAKPKQPSTAQQAIEGFTGKTAVKQGRKAMDKLEAVSAQKNDELDEVM